MADEDLSLNEDPLLDTLDDGNDVSLSVCIDFCPFGLTMGMGWVTPLF